MTAMKRKQNLKYDGHGYLAKRCTSASGYFCVHKRDINHPDHKWVITLNSSDENLLTFRIPPKSSFELTLQQYARLAAVGYELYVQFGEAGFPEVVRIDFPGSPTLYMIKSLDLITTKEPSSLINDPIKLDSKIWANWNPTTKWMFEPVEYDLFTVNDYVKAETTDEAEEPKYETPPLHSYVENEQVDGSEDLDPSEYVEMFYKELKKGTFNSEHLVNMKNIIIAELKYGLGA